MKFAMLAVIHFLVTFSPLYAQQRAHSINAPAAALLVPVAGSAPGAMGTYFRTDLHIVNHLDVAQDVWIGFYAAGQQFLYGDPLVEVTVVLKPRSTTTYEDVGATLFFGSGLGSIVINPADWSNFKPEARLDATYRIWTVQPGGSGTLSQSSAALDMLALPGGREKRTIIGVRLDADFRCNVGVFNYSYALDRSFLITARSPSGSVTTTVKVGGYSMAQVPLPSADLGYITVTVEPLDTNDSDVWAAYASSIDNRSGDSWLQNATVSR